MQGECGSRIVLDGTLIENLEGIGLETDCGSITVKDATADQITLISKSGDILMEGILDGDSIAADTDGDGAVLIAGKGIFVTDFNLPTVSTLAINNRGL